MNGAITWYTMNGIAPDLIPSEVPPSVWTRCSDMVFRGQPERIAGRLSVFGTPLFPPQWLQDARSSGEAPIWVYAADAGLGVTDGTIHTDITPASGWGALPFPNPFTGGTLNGVVVVGSGSFFYYDGAPKALPLPGWPAGFTANAMRPYKYHLIAMGITDNGTLLEDLLLWSAAAVPGEIPQTWAPAPDNEAGSLALSQTGGEIVDGFPLRQSFCVYKDTSTYIIDYIGGTNVMQARLLYPNSGLLCRNGVALYRGDHYALTDGDIVVNDGQQITSIADRVVRRRIFGFIDGENFRNSFAVADEARSEVWFCVPEQGHTLPNVAWIYNVGTQKWGRRELPGDVAHIGVGPVRLSTGPVVWDQFPMVWDLKPGVWLQSSGRVNNNSLLEAAPGANKLYAVDLDYSRDGVVVNGSLEREYLDLGQPDAVKTIRRVWLTAQSFSAGQRLQISVGASQSLEVAPTYEAPVLYTIGVDRKVDIYATGFFISLKIEAYDDGIARQPWRVGKVGFEYTLRGMF